MDKASHPTLIPPSTRHQERIQDALQGLEDLERHIQGVSGKADTHTARLLEVLQTIVLRQRIRLDINRDSHFEATAVIFEVFGTPRKWDGNIARSLARIYGMWKE